MIGGRVKLHPLQVLFQNILAVLIFQDVIEILVFLGISENRNIMPSTGLEGHDSVSSLD